LDETLIIFNSLLTEEFASKRNKNTTIATALGNRISNLIRDITYNHFFCKQIEDYDHIMIKADSLCSFDDERELRQYDFSEPVIRPDGSIDYCKISYRYRFIRDVYNGIIDIRSLLSSTGVHEVNTLYSEIDKFTTGWLGRGKNLLKLAMEKKEVLNVLITSGQLVPTIAKMIAYRLNDIIPIQNIYSSSTVGKHWCLNKIKSQYKNAKFIVIGDGNEERDMSILENIPFYKISDSCDLLKLHSKLLFNIETVLIPT